MRRRRAAYGWQRDGGHAVHLVGHSFGCRFLCEAVQWAADARLDDTLGWRAAGQSPSRPFTVGSMLLFQMAAGRDAFLSLFPYLLPSQAHDGASLRGPCRMIFFWHGGDVCDPVVCGV